MQFITRKKSEYHNKLNEEHRDKNLWTVLKEFINSININETFTRKEMLAHIYDFNFNVHRHTTDCYRNDLCHCGFIEKTEKRGVYKKIRHIPIGMTMTQVRKIGYDKTWTEWFVPLETKLEKMGLE